MSIQEIKSTVTKVTVYTDRAMVTRAARATLLPTERQVRVVGLPMNVQEDSLRINARGTAALTLLDFRLSQQSFKEVPEAALKTLEEEKQRFQDQIVALRDEIATITHQKSFLQEIGVGKSKHFSKDLDVQRPVLDDWKSVLEFLGKEQRGLDATRREMELKIRKHEADIRLIEAELQKYAGARTKTRKVVTIDVEVGAEGEFEFEIGYLIQDAHWQPMYDARVDAKAKRVSLRYMGLVTQRTGEDWAGVEVLLSTARPQLGGNAPELRAWYVSEAARYRSEDAEMYLEGGGGASRSMKKRSGAPQAMAAMAPMAEEALSLGEVDADERVASVEQGQGASVVFRCAGGGDVPGDGSGAKLLIMDDDFENRFRYLSIPKLAELVYLTAEVKNSTDFPLLPGRVSVFLDGNFVGHSHLHELITPGEKFELPLGVDEGIKVRRKLQKHKDDEKGLFSRSHVEEFSYLITLESHRDSDEEVVVRDQLPVSTNEKIKVETRALQPAENPEKDKDRLANGVVEWKLQLTARSTQKLEISFVVTYPKEMDVNGL